MDRRLVMARPGEGRGFARCTGGQASMFAGTRPPLSGSTFIVAWWTKRAVLSDKNTHDLGVHAVFQVAHLVMAVADRGERLLDDSARPR